MSRGPWLGGTDRQERQPSGQRIRELRLAAGLSLRKLLSNIEARGAKAEDMMTFSNLSKVERGKAPLRLAPAFAEALAHELGFDGDVSRMWREEPPPRSTALDRRLSRYGASAADERARDAHRRMAPGDRF